ncbi:MAG: DinB family protein [Acidobacteria bacterium]|nr:DinB family protein [Acidobacteriota bacterium]
METINQEFFTKNILSLLKETFEGSSPEGSAYLDRGVGVLNTIEKISAEKASHSIGENGATIAAHLEHARFYLVILLEFMNGRTEKVDWNESWLVKTVGETEWNALRENTNKAYQKVTETFQTIEDWDDDKVGGAMVIVVHTAYHLGAIRQIAKSI